MNGSTRAHFRDVAENWIPSVEGPPKTAEPSGLSSVIEAALNVATMAEELRVRLERKLEPIMVQHPETPEQKQGLSMPIAPAFGEARENMARAWNALSAIRRLIDQVDV